MTHRFKAWDKHPEKQCWALDGKSFTIDEVMNWEEPIGIDLVYVQSTGLFDKHKKEIYCGDIVSAQTRLGNITFVCEWNELEPSFHFKIIKAEKKHNAHAAIGDIWGISSVNNVCEIIGDIYSSPQLLK